jgi:WD40 repeat protein
MRTRWLPLLTTDKPTEGHDERGPLNPLQGLVLFGLNNSEPLKLMLYSVPFVALTLWMFAQWQQSISRELAAEALATVEAEPDRALVLSREAYRQSQNEQTRSALFATIERTRWIDRIVQAHPFEVSDVAFGRSNQYFATVQETEGRRIVLWDVTKREPAAVYSPDSANQHGIHTVRSDGYESVSFAGSDSVVIAWGPDWQMSSTRVDIRSAPNLASINQLGFPGIVAFHAPTGRIAFAQANYVTLRDDPRRRRDSFLPDQDVKGLQFSGDGGLLLANTQTDVFVKDLALERIDPEMHFYRLGADRRLEENGRHAVVATALNDDATLVAAVGGGVLQMWDVSTGRSRYVVPTPQGLLLKDVAFWPGKDAVITAGGGGATNAQSISVFQASTGRLLGPLLVGFADATNAVAFSPNGQFMVSGANDGKVTLWALGNASPLSRPLDVPSGRLVTMATSPGDQWVVLAYRDRRIVLFDPIRSVTIASDSAPGRDPPVALTFAPSGRRFYVGTSDGTVSVWDTRTHEVTASAALSEMNGLFTLQLSSRNDRLVAVGRDGRIVLMDATRLTPFGEPMHQEGFGNAIATFMPGDRHLMVTRAGWLRVWDLERGVPVHSGAAKLFNTDGLKFRPDGAWLASREGYQLSIYRTKELAPLLDPRDTLFGGAGTFSRPTFSLLGHTEPITAFDWSPDGKWLATASAEFASPPSDLADVASIIDPRDQQTIMLWSGTTGQRVGESIQIAGPPITELHFSRDSKTLFALSDDGVRTVDLDPAVWMRRAEAIAPRDLTREERARYMPFQTPMYRVLASLKHLVSLSAKQ